MRRAGTTARKGGPGKVKLTRSRIRFIARSILHSLWFTPAAYALLALGLLIIAPVLAPFLPEPALDLIGLDGIYDLLNVLANTLLAVAIFSLGIMVSSMQAAAEAATPRARPLMSEDRTAQNAISTFIGGFIFSVVGMIGLSTEYYSEAARLILFFVTCLVVLAVIVALIRWIGRLSNIGDVTEVINIVETATRAAFDDVARSPHFGGVPSPAALSGPFPIMADALGFVQVIDPDSLGRVAHDTQTDLHLAVRPGSYVDPSRALVYATRDLDAAACETVRAAFVIGAARTFQTDPRFGLTALSEIASRALSPGVNDPGTAIRVIGTSVRILAGWSAARHAAEPQVDHPRLHVPAVSIDDVMGDAFRWIARDGAALLEVQIRVQKGLATLAAIDPDLFGAAARAQSQEALARAEQALVLPDDIAVLRAIAAEVGATA